MQARYINALQNLASGVLRMKLCNGNIHWPVTANGTVYMERGMTDLETLLPFVHAIHPFDAELPVGQVYMSFYSAAVVTKHDVGTKQVISNLRVAILPSTDIGLF